MVGNGNYSSKRAGFPGTDFSDRLLLQQCAGDGGAENNVCLVGLEVVPEQNQSLS